jgi:hypothetical protein
VAASDGVFKNVCNATGRLIGSGGYDQVMTSGHVSSSSGYAGVAQSLARQALSVATDNAPHRAREGEKRFPLAKVLPATRMLIGDAEADDRLSVTDTVLELSQTLAEPNGHVTDGFGHHRPVYALLAIHLLGTAAKLMGDLETLAQVKQAATLLLNRKSIGSDALDPRLAAWRRLIARQHGLEEAEDLPLACDEPAPLVSLGLNDLIDSWTYYELVGLHGLHLSSLIEQDKALADRVRWAAEYHLGHTQPDYTTYQPWGLAAFASNPQTTVFAEQQLHDVATHLSIEGPGGAVMPALLLADAAATMAGRLSSAWAEP